MSLIFCYIIFGLITVQLSFMIIVFKASLRRRLGAKAQLEVKASRRLEIRRKATVAAEKNLEERGGCGGEKEIRRRGLRIRLRRLEIWPGVAVFSSHPRR
jgi:hypothetical protein